MGSSKLKRYQYVDASMQFSYLPYKIKKVTQFALQLEVIKN